MIHVYEISSSLFIISLRLSKLAYSSLNYEQLIGMNELEKNISSLKNGYYNYKGNRNIESESNSYEENSSTNVIPKKRNSNFRFSTIDQIGNLFSVIRKTRDGILKTKITYSRSNFFPNSTLMINNNMTTTVLSSYGLGQYHKAVELGADIKNSSIINLEISKRDSSSINNLVDKIQDLVERMETMYYYDPTKAIIVNKEDQMIDKETMEKKRKGQIEDIIEKLMIYFD